MKYLKIYISLILISFFTVQCTTSTDPSGTTDKTTSETPSDHNVNEHGVMHKSGLRDPENNCVGCHGSDLRGGDSAPSCYSCHNKKW